jgi:hypothetical protein
VVAINAHRVDAHRPAIAIRARLGSFHAINFKAFVGAASNPALIAGSTLSMSKLVPLLDADLLHQSEDWLLVDVNNELPR